MKRLLFILIPSLMSLASCTALLNEGNGGWTDGDYRNGRDYTHNGKPLPPPDNRYGNGYRNNQGYPYGYQEHRPTGSQHGGRYYRPELGTLVPTLGTQRPQTIKVNGQTIYEVNGVYYEAVRTSAGIQYKVVGYSQRR